MERIEADAEGLIRDFGVAAYGEARRREHEASSDPIAGDWESVALAVARLIARLKDVDPEVRLAMNAVLVPDREKVASQKPQFLSALTSADELTHLHASTTFQIQFIGAARDRALTTF